MQPSVVGELVPAFGEYLIAARDLQWCVDDWQMPSIVRFYVVRAVCVTIDWSTLERLLLAAASTIPWRLWLITSEELS